MADVRVDTAKLRAYAARINAVNSRLQQIDQSLNGLYWQFGLLDVFRILQADLVLHYSGTLARCSQYLNDTADRFETVERMLINENPLTFTALPALPADLFFEPATSISFGDPNSLFVSVGTLLGNPDYLFSTGTSLDVVIAGYTLLHDETTASFLTGQADAGAHAEFDVFDRNGNLDLQNIGIGARAEASGTVAELTENTELFDGELRINQTIQVLSGSAIAEAQCRLWQDGRFNPQYVSALYAEAHGIHGDVSVETGDEMFGSRAFADGDVGYAAGGAELRVGDLGNDEFGIDTHAAAMASALHGEVGGTRTFLGIDVTASVGGDVGSIGAEGGFFITNRRIGVNGKVAELLGLEADICIDWSDNEIMCASADYAVDTGLDTVTFVGDVGENAYNAFTSIPDRGLSGAAYDFATNTMSDASDFVSDRIDATMEFGEDLLDAGSDLVDSAADWVGSWWPL